MKRKTFDNKCTAIIFVVLLQLLSFKVIAAKLDSLRTDSLKLISLNEYVISSERWPILRSNTSSDVCQISSNIVREYNPQTTADLLSVSGKVFIQKSQQAGGSPSIRGFSSNRLLYTLDGIRLNTAIFRGGNIQNVINIDPFSLANTEVVFGPGSVIYGSDAIGGVMTFQSIDPTFSTSKKTNVSGNIFGRYSTANSERTIHTDIRMEGEKVALISGFSRWNFGDVIQGKYGPSSYLDNRSFEYSGKEKLQQHSTSYNQTNAFNKLKWKAAENLEIVFSNHFSKTSEFGRYDKLQELKGDLPKYSKWNYGPQVWHLNYLSALISRKTVFFDELNAVMSHQIFKESRITQKWLSSEKITRKEKVNAFGLNLDFNKNFHGRLSINYGLELIYNQIKSFGEVENENNNKIKKESSRYPTSDWRNYSFYVSNSIVLKSEVRVFFGVRYSSYFLNSDFTENLEFYRLPFREVNINNGALNLSLGYVQNVNEWLSSKVNLTTGYRAPNVDDIGKVFSSSPGTVTVPNVDLKAEYAYNIDLNLEAKWNSKIQCSISAFYTVLDNAMQVRPYELNGSSIMTYDHERLKVFAVQNSGVTRIFGIENSIIYNFFKSISLKSVLNVQNGTDTNLFEERIPSRYVVPLFGFLELKYSLERLKLSLLNRFQGEVSADKLPLLEKDKPLLYAVNSYGESYSPSWMTTDFRVNHEISEKFSTQIAVENLFDRRYRTYRSGVSAAGRNYVFSMNYNF
ncbi:TonB-dependent receptor plug domain-containing protein [Jiulongibacter sp. NS-SX5]|uniref:TonB-dependent receptor plug domain-containing protein n=1 Tax=Jiulongibacter sp. NS-SX5 TaxID=3463854 RepID=UPI00405875CC